MKKIIIYFALMLTVFSACEKEESDSDRLASMEVRLNELSDKITNLAASIDVTSTAGYEKMVKDVAQIYSQVHVFYQDLQNVFAIVKNNADIVEENKKLVEKLDLDFKSMLSQFLELQLTVEVAVSSIPDDNHIMSLFPDISDLAILAGVKDELEKTYFKNFAGMIKELVLVKQDLYYAQLSLLHKSDDTMIKQYISEVETSIRKSTLQLTAYNYFDEKSLSALNKYVSDLGLATKEYTEEIIRKAAEEAAKKALEDIVFPDHLENASIDVVGSQTNASRDNVVIRLIGTVKDEFKNTENDIFGENTTNPVYLRSYKHKAVKDFPVYIKVNPGNVNLLNYKVQFVNSAGEQLPNVSLVLEKYDGVVTRASENMYKIKMTYTGELTDDAVKLFNRKTKDVMYCFEFSRGNVKVTSTLNMSIDNTISWHNFGSDNNTILNTYSSEITFNFTYKMFGANPYFEFPINDFAYYANGGIEDSGIKAWRIKNRETAKDYIDPSDPKNLIDDYVDKEIRTSIKSLKSVGDLSTVIFKPTGKMLDTDMYYVECFYDGPKDKKEINTKIWNYCTVNSLFFRVIDSRRQLNNTIIKLGEMGLSSGDRLIFTIHVLNYDGTRVDPDGKSFIVNID
jgi:hypothetical protein